MIQDPFQLERELFDMELPSGQFYSISPEGAQGAIDIYSNASEESRISYKHNMRRSVM